LWFTEITVKIRFSTHWFNSRCEPSSNDWKLIVSWKDRIRQIIRASTFPNKSKTVSEYQDSLYSLWNCEWTSFFEESNSHFAYQIRQPVPESRIAVLNLEIAEETFENDWTLHWGRNLARETGNCLEGSKRPRR
jgi:hypothetical protein